MKFSTVLAALAGSAIANPVPAPEAEESKALEKRQSINYVQVSAKSLPRQIPDTTVLSI